LPETLNVEGRILAVGVETLEEARRGSSPILERDAETPETRLEFESPDAEETYF